MSRTALTSDHLQLGNAGSRAFTTGLGVCAGGFALSAVLAFFTSWNDFFRAYLVAFMLLVSVSLGGLIFTMIHHITRAGWSTVVRRISEALACNVQWLWILFIPILIAMFGSEWSNLYLWNIAEHVEHDHVLQQKAAYLNPWFWMIRAAVFFGVWIMLSRFFWSQSVAQDRDGEVNRTHAMQKYAPVGILLFAITATFAAVDWMMSLEPHWFSTIYGVYFFATSMCAFFSAMIIIVFLLQRAGRVVNEITLEHYQDLGKFLFAFGIVFWAYIAFSQYMLIWYGNIPEETGWYFPRQIGGWQWLSLLLLVGHFAVPFVFWVSKHPKRNPKIAAAFAVFMLLMTVADLYYLIVPQVPHDLLAETSHEHLTTYGQVVEAYHHDAVSTSVATAHGYAADAGPTYADVYGLSPGLIDLTLLAGMVGLYIAMTVRRLGMASLVPQRDPRIDESLAFENM